MVLKDRQKAKSTLLGEGLAKSTVSVGACPDPGTLGAYYERSLDARETQSFEAHLSSCPLCREQIAAMVRADESAIAGTQRTEESRWAWLWDWRWLAPAAAVLALAVIWLARKPTAVRTAGQQPLVAMSQPKEAPLPTLAFQAPASERDTSAAALTANKATTVAKEPLRGSRSYAPSSDLKEQAGASKGGENNITESEDGALAGNNPGPSAAPRAPAPALLPSPTADDQSSASIGGGVVGGTPLGAAKQPPGPPPVASELVSRYLTQDEKASLQTAYRRSLDIRSPDPQVLWRAPGGGLIERSIDGGVTWQAQRPVRDAHIVAGMALSAKTCWIAGRDGIILLTTDGTNWATIPPPVRADFVSISARDDLSATVTTADGRKFTTQDAGKKWQPAQ